jgi:hypothetical protein
MLFLSLLVYCDEALMKREKVIFLLEKEEMVYYTLKGSQNEVQEDVEKIMDSIIDFLHKNEDRLTCATRSESNFIKFYEFLDELLSTKIYKITYRYTDFLSKVYLTDNNGNIIYTGEIDIYKIGISVKKKNEEEIKLHYQRLIKGNSVFPLYDQQKLVKKQIKLRNPVWEQIEYLSTLFSSRYTPGSASVETIPLDNVLESTDIIMYGNNTGVEDNQNAGNWDFTWVPNLQQGEYGIQNPVLPSGYNSIIVSLCSAGGAGISSLSGSYYGGSGSGAYVRMQFPYTFTVDNVVYTISSLFYEYAGNNNTAFIEVYYNTIYFILINITNGSSSANQFGGSPGTTDIFYSSTWTLSSSQLNSLFPILINSNGAQGGSVNEPGLSTLYTTSGAGESDGTNSNLPPDGIPCNAGQEVTGMTMSGSIYTITSQGAGYDPTTQTIIPASGQGGGGTSILYTQPNATTYTQPSFSFCEILCQT